jgi:beta-lactam-binding protein with PASTA domain
MTWTADTTYVTADSTYATADGSGVALGVPINTVVNALINNGLMITPSIVWAPSTFNYGTVSSISPQGGATVPLWTYVTLTVSSGPLNTVTNVTVPNLIGLQQYYAHQSIGQTGLTWLVDLYQYSATVPATCVIAQSIAAGTSVTPSTTIQITVSLGPQPTQTLVVVP